MARTLIHPTRLVVNGSAVEPSAATIPTGAGNGVFVVPAEADAEQLILKLTAAAPTNITVKAGVFPLAPSSGQGDLVIALAAGTPVYAGPFESARFAQADGSIAVEADAAATVVALKASRH